MVEEAKHIEADHKPAKSPTHPAETGSAGITYVFEVQMRWGVRRTKRIRETTPTNVYM